MNLNNKSILLIDGECLLCDGFLKFVLKRDYQKRFFYTHLQSFPTKNYNIIIPKDGLKTVYLWHEGTVYQKSDVTVIVLEHLGGIWKIGSYIIRMFPKYVRDFWYDLIAKYRYKIWGKSDTCLIPSEDEKAQFIDPNSPQFDSLTGLRWFLQAE